jgi:Ca2+-transporting ATPase
MNWHQKSVDEVLRDLQASFQGLTPEEAEKRLNQYGPNDLVAKKKRTPFLMFLDQFKSRVPGI